MIMLLSNQVSKISVTKPGFENSRKTKRNGGITLQFMILTA